LSLPGRSEIERGLFGAWRIARTDPQALRWFDLSADGFYRSFTAMLLVLPVWLVLVALDRAPPDAEFVPPLALELAVQTVAFVFGWAGFAALMLPVAMLLRLQERYVAYIVASNWAQVLQLAALLPAVLLAASGVLPEPAGAGLLAAVTLLLLVYAGQIARAGLGCRIVEAVGIVALQVVWDVLVRRTADGLLLVLAG